MRNRWGKLGATFAVLGTVVVVGQAAPASVGEGACSQPYQPVYAVRNDPLEEGPAQAIPDYPVDPIRGEELWVSFAEDRLPFDMDGDGKPDRASGSTITRGDGKVTIVGAEVFGPLGDLDADGHDEVLLRSAGSAWWILPGTTAPGSHAVGDAAIEVEEGLPVSSDLGDVVGGTGDDVVVSEAVVGKGDRYVVVAGEDLMAPGPGGALATLPSEEALPGWVLGAVPFGGGVGVLGFDGAPGDYRHPWIWSHGVLTRLAYPTAIDVSVLFGVWVVEAEHTYLLISPNDRAPLGYATYWDLDDPCAQLRRVAGTTTTSQPSGAPPVSPVDGDAGFTG